MVHPESRIPDIFLGQPLYGREVDCGAATAATVGGSKGKLTYSYARYGGSSLPHVFNMLWTGALSNPQFKYFAMLHGDLEPETGWLDVLYDEMKRTGATVVSVSNAIKDDKGVTSTAVGSPTDLYDYRRITTTEQLRLPQTFGIEEIAAAGIWSPDRTDGKCLLANTGCWIADLTWPHWKTTDENGFLKFRFEQFHRVQVWPDGHYNCEFAPEDWLMSRYVHNNGGKVVATRAVKTIHVGTRVFPNYIAWGPETDEEIDRFREQKRQAFAAHQEAPDAA
jgi:hypothetical protein